jgi:hypothetical protein
MTGRIQISIYDSNGEIKHDFSLGNHVEDLIVQALAGKIRKDESFPDEFVPNFIWVGNNLNQYQIARISTRHTTSGASMYFFIEGIQFEQGQDNMYIVNVGLAPENYAGGVIAYAFGSAVNGVFFNPSDTIKVAYTINVAPAEINTNLANNYFKEVASIMLGGPDSGGVYVAINEKYVVPNRAVLQAVSADLVSKDFIPKGTGTFIGTSEGDLEWNGVSGSATPYYVKWVSRHYSRPDLVIGTTDLDQPLREAYPAGTNIETRFSMELRN